jgi:D-alanyl-D-alanine carboxypeptidase
MTRLRFGSALSAVALASLLASCAAPGGVKSASNRNVDQKLGFATRAVMAMTANDYVSAISFAEQAVEKSPEDSEVRALLANAYFGAGRFASAEAAYRDALKINENQPKVLLKLVLVDIAQGKNNEALTFLNAARPLLEPADYGLALALAGHPAEAIATLEPAARSRGADARVRQNLALSYALAGDWTAARTVAAQDVPADQLDGRIQGWMQLANPARPSDQIAALTGVTPAVVDPGQPVRLALNRVQSGVATAQATPVTVAPVPVAVAAPVPVAAAPAPVQVAQAAPQSAVPASSVVEDLPFVDVPAQRPAQTAYVVPKVAKPVAPKASAPVRAASYVPKRPTVIKAAMPRANGKSTAVLQLGAYGSPERVAAAWNAASRRYSALRGYMPVSARFQNGRGTFYRLSVKGFQNADQAKNLCIALRRAGGTCFVRAVAGDAPVQIAMR